MGDTPDAGGPEPNLAVDLGDKTGAVGAKPSIADDDKVVLTFLGDKTGAGGGDPNQAADLGDKTGAGGALGDTPGAGGPEPNLAADLGDKTGAGGAKPSIADDDGMVLTFLPPPHRGEWC